MQERWGVLLFYHPTSLEARLTCTNCCIRTPMLWFDILVNLIFVFQSKWPRSLPNFYQVKRPLIVQTLFSCIPFEEKKSSWRHIKKSKFGRFVAHIYILWNFKRGDFHMCIYWWSWHKNPSPKTLMIKTKLTQLKYQIQYCIRGLTILWQNLCCTTHVVY